MSRFPNSFKYYSWKLILKFKILQDKRMRFDPISNPNWIGYENTIEDPIAFYTDPQNLRFVLERNQDLIIEPLDTLIPKLINFYSDAFNARKLKDQFKGREDFAFKVFCCSVRHDIFGNWETFGDNHLGLCFEFRNEVLAKKYNLIGRLIDYNLSESAEVCINPDLNLKQQYEAYKLLYFTLQKRTSYQEEIRFLKTPYHNFGTYLQLDISDIRTVFIGHRLISELGEKEVVKVIRQHLPLSDIYKMILCEENLLGHEPIFNLPRNQV